MKKHRIHIVTSSTGAQRRKDDYQEMDQESLHGGDKIKIK
jgi:hypothetical protein